jgi:adenine-specific DNA-methyltransferase
LNYIGSKIRLAPFILQTIGEIAGGLQGRSFADLFAGTGAISVRVKPFVGELVANDWEPYAQALLTHYLNPKNEAASADWFSHLNALLPSKGFIWDQYAPGGSAGRQYFSDENSQRIDAIRIELQRLQTQNAISAGGYAHLLASLLESADKVANTASVYEAYLKQLKATARAAFQLKPAEVVPGSPVVKVFREDANQLIKRLKGDILYLDPPYNRRQYGSCYHLLNTITQYQPFLPKGKTGLPVYQRSAYCSKRQALDAFINLIKQADFDYIFLSYNNEGLMSTEEVRAALQMFGSYDLARTSYQRYKADRPENRTYIANATEEYLHILQRKAAIRPVFKGWAVQQEKVW